MVGLFQVPLFATFAMKFRKTSITSLHVKICMKKRKMTCAFVLFKNEDKTLFKIIAQQSNLSP